MSKNKIKLLNGIVLCLMGLTSATADDTLLGLMQKLKATPVSTVAYQETRTLKLMDGPWHGSGYLYSQSPDLMIREQLQPQRLIMGVKGDKALYFDPKNNDRHQSDLAGDDELSVPLAVMKALVNADESLLRSLFDIEFSSTSDAWTMNLKPKQKTSTVAKIIVTGPSGQQATKISTMEKEGDISEFNLQRNANSSQSNATIAKLYQELLGE